MITRELSYVAVGFQIEEHDNPADFFLDVILGNLESTNPTLLMDVAPVDSAEVAVVVPVTAANAGERVSVCYNL